LVLSFNAGANLKAQSVDPLRVLNNNLRAKFGGLIKPTPTKEYNSDMAGHQTNKLQWTNLNSTTFINTDV
jgi:hypothetical protein